MGEINQLQYAIGFQLRRSNMKNQISKEHWLKQLVGDWTYVLSVGGGLPEAGATVVGTERVWTIGDLWIVAENRETGDGSSSHSISAISFQPETGRFAGSVASSMTPSLFVYDGDLSEDGTALLLETEGPALSDDRKTDRYRDIIRITGADTRELTAEVREADGAWRRFMVTRYHRAVA
jgi:hypothetical protein